MTDEYYTPGQIRFQRWEMLWLIQWLPILEEGNWPPDPKETGYTETPNVQRSRRNHGAHFETPAQIYIEVTSRLEKTGESGEVLVWEVQHGLNAYQLLSKPAQKALNYISGWRRRTQKYRDWARQQKYRNKIKEAS